jgi:uncharacterized protein YggE
MKNLLFISLFITTFLTYGQTIPQKADDKPYIEVTGTAEMEVEPDQIFIRIVIKERYENRTKVEIEEQEEKMKTALKSINIDLTNLYLSDANADFVKISWRKNNLITKKEYTLKVSNATTVGKVFQELEKLEITDAYIERVSHSRIDSLRKEVRIIAIKAAKEKADYLLSAIGEKTGKPLKIMENPQQIWYENGINSQESNTKIIVSGGIPNSYGDIENEIKFEKIKLSSSIFVKFEIQ